MSGMTYLCPDCGSPMRLEYKSRMDRIYQCTRCLKRIFQSA
jgi:hypothetical protein